MDGEHTDVPDGVPNKRWWHKLKALKWELNKARHEAREERLAKEEALRSADQARRQATQGGAFNDPDDSRARYLNASRTSPFTVITGRR